MRGAVELTDRSMSLTFIESVVLWGVPILTILITLLHYYHWGKESEEGSKLRSDDNDSATNEGGL